MESASGREHQFVRDVSDHSRALHLSPPAERPLQVVEWSFEILSGEQPVAVLPIDSAAETE